MQIESKKELILKREDGEEFVIQGNDLLTLKYEVDNLVNPITNTVSVSSQWPQDNIKYYAQPVTTSNVLKG